MHLQEQAFSAQQTQHGVAQEQPFDWLFKTDGYPHLPQETLLELCFLTALLNLFFKTGVSTYLRKLLVVAQL